MQRLRDGSCTQVKRGGIVILAAALALLATVGVLIAQGGDGEFEVVADAGSFSPGSATLLHDGAVLLAGSGDARLYDAGQRAFKGLFVPEELRDDHRATLLQDGTVLFTGGRTVDFDAETGTFPVTTFTDALIYDPGSEQFTAVAPMSVPRSGHSATVLPDGRVLILGGSDQQGPFSDLPAVHDSAEIYDPSTRQFSPAGSLNVARQNHAATLLPDGTVAVTGGSDSARSILQSVEIFDPESEMSRDVLQTSGFFSTHAAFPRPDGTIALVGGFAGAEIIDLETGFTRSVVTGEDFPGGAGASTNAIVVLQDGRVLLIGGSIFVTDVGSSSLSSSVLIDLDAGTAAEGPTLNTPRQSHVSVTLLDGSVLVFGGTDRQDGAFVEFVTAVEQLIGLPAVLPVLPVPPAHSFSGDAGTGSGAQLDGTLAPDGTTVQAVNENGDLVGEAEIVDGAWSIAVRPEDAQTVTFTVGDSLPSEPFEVVSGTVGEVPLDLGSPTQEFVLGPGFNLTGWLGATPVEEATASIAGQFDSIFRWDAAAGTFDTFQTTGPTFLTDLEELVFGDAVWIFINDPAGAVWEQPTFTDARDVDLLAGFNLVLWTGADGTPVEEAFAGIAADLIGASIWDQPNQAFLTFAPDAPSFVNSAEVLTYGEGVWVQMSAPATWSQPASAP